MWIQSQFTLGGTQRFFYLTFRGKTLQAYYGNMFTLTHQYKYTLTELENMIPWERDLYIGMVNNWVKEEIEKAKQTRMEQESKLNALVRKKNMNRSRRR